MPPPPRRRVTMIVANVKQFRAAFYPQLQAALAPLGIELTVVYSDPSASERTKKDSIDLPTPLGRKVARWYLMDERLMLQWPGLRELARSDLVVIVQATGYLMNYPLLALSALRLKRVAFWGHGYNRQGRPDSWSERLKRSLARSSDWWFAYTEQTAQYLASIGVDPLRITAIQNAVDTRSLRAAAASVTPEEIDDSRRRLGLRSTDRVALYCGSLYPEKRIAFLLDAARRIQREVPGFRLLIAGSGIEAEVVRQACRDSDAIRYAGPLFGRPKAVGFRLAELFLSPGAVGLGILDSFACGLPLVTSAAALHGPEIAYLEDGVNGLMVEGDVERFAAAVIGLLNEPARIARLAVGARAAADRYTVESMVKKVATGIAQALELRR